MGRRRCAPRCASSQRAAFLEKPFAPEVLAMRVREVLDAEACELPRTFAAPPPDM